MIRARKKKSKKNARPLESRQPKKARRQLVWPLMGQQYLPERTRRTMLVELSADGDRQGIFPCFCEVEVRWL